VKNTLNFKILAYGLSILSLASAIGGCGPDDPIDGSGGSGGGGGGGPQGELYAISTVVFSPDLTSRTEHIAFADSLTQSGTIDDSLAIELSSENSTIWASTKAGEFFLLNSGTGGIEKYGLGSDGTVEKKATMGFSAYGVNGYYWPLVAIASDTKAFMFDEKTLQGFVWNPSEMTITKDFDLAPKFNTDENGTTLTVWRERAPIRIGNKFYASFHYYDLATKVTGTRSGMIIMDADTDTFSVVEHPSCGGLFYTVLGSDGWIYAATGVVGAAGHFLNVPGSAPSCMVRFDPKTMAFDPAFNVDLDALVGPGKFVGGLLANNQSASDGPVYTRVLLDQNVPGAIVNPLQIAAAAVWDTYKIDNIEAPTTATRSEVPPGGGAPYPFYIDGKTYVADADVPAGKSWFVDYSVDPPKRELEMDGWGWFAVRVR